MRRLISPAGKQINERIPGGAGPPSWSGAPAAGFSTPVVPWPGFGRSGEKEKTPYMRGFHITPRVGLEPTALRLTDAPEGVRRGQNGVVSRFSVS